jgi:hypothetical protein
MLKPAIVLSMTFLTAVALTGRAPADDTDRVANCAAAADMASAAAKSRDAGVSLERTTLITYQGASNAVKEEVKTTVAEVYDNAKLTPDQASSKVLQECLEIETE